MMEADDVRGEETVLRSARTLADLLPCAAAMFTQRPAVVGPERTLSFADADRTVDAVAATLAAGGVASADHVVVMTHKTANSFLIIHALLRVGAVVVPLDPLMPVASAGAVIDDVAPTAIVVDQTSTQRLDVFGEAFGGLAVFSVDGASGDEAPGRVTSLRDPLDTPENCEPLVDRPTVRPEDPAYVIFTSGSTGTPKGMTHTHRSAMAYAELAVEAHGITSDDCLAGMPPLHFDMSTLELYSAPLAGASIVPIGAAELRFPADFTARAEAERITVWYSVPFQLRQISERGALEQRDLASLRHVIYAGEAFSAPALSALMAQLPGVRFTNAYGPAETNVVTIHELDAPPTDAVPIGRPWGDVEVAIVEPERPVVSTDDLVDLPTGAIGELWVKAASTMSGYLGQPDLSAERLVGPSGNRWYRTGDLVRRDDQGVLSLAGRIDHQVKVRGTRLELEAIETVLAGNPQIADAVVAPDLSGTSIDHLVGAVTLAPDVSELDQRSLRRWCASKLVPVAIPLDVDVWDAFPLTSSGKIDRNRVRSSLNESNDVTPGTPNGEPKMNGSFDV